MEPLIQQNITVPALLQKLLNRPAHAEQLEPDLKSLKAVLESAIK